MLGTPVLNVMILVKPVIKLINVSNVMLLTLLKLELPVLIWIVYLKALVKLLKVNLF